MYVLTSICEVIDLFTNLEDKSSLKFLKFDILAFNPSFSQELFDKVICWSKQFYDFTKQQLDVINNSRKSFLFLNDQTWTKKNKENFDVTMGAYDGAEVAELTGLYILEKMKKIIKPTNIGLYRDDGLAVVQGSGPEIERMRKKIFVLFKEIKLKVSIEANITSTEFQSAPNPASVNMSTQTSIADPNDT